MKRGFTLIELLAVIVILAIIALIATPIILEVISNTKEEAVVRSAENYLNAVELSIATEAMNDSTKKLDGTYQIISNGKEIQKGTETPIKVEYDGEGLEKGKITIKDGKIKRVMNGKIGNQTYVKTTSGKNEPGQTIILDYEPAEVTLLSGQNFNSAIKTLVLGNGTKVSHGTSDQIVTSIEFLSYGMLPEEYTLNDLDDMDKTNVSAGNDNKIMAYYDKKGKVFVYSKDLIVFNKLSYDMLRDFQSMRNLLFGEIDTSSVTNMNGMFRGLSNLNRLDLSSFDTSSVTDMSNMFALSTGLTELDLSNFDTSKVTEMGSMFAFNSNLEKLDVSSFDTSNVKNMSQMFRELSLLTELDISNFKTSNVQYMNSMFYGCKFEKLDLSNFDTSKVTNMSAMFQSCSGLTSLDVSNFITTNVTDMNTMFSSCRALKELDLSNFDTSGVTKMNTMFAFTQALEKLNISSFIFKDSVTTADMFRSVKSGMNIIVGGETQKAFIESLNTSAKVTIAQ